MLQNIKHASPIKLLDKCVCFLMDIIIEGVKESVDNGDGKKSGFHQERGITINNNHIYDDPLIFLNMPSHQ